MFWGLDGEGITVNDWHSYVYMAACSTDGKTKQLYNKGEPLNTYDILWWLWKIPGDYRFFYSSGYDWTMILRDIDKETLRQIVKTKDPFEPIWWRDFGISYLRGAVTLSKEFTNAKTGESRRVDKFYGDLWKCLGAGSFANAIELWKIGTEDERHLITETKKQRAQFSQMTREIQHYCLLEVRLLADLAKKALCAAAERDITPRRWFSAGSAAKHVMRSQWKIPDHRGEDRYARADGELRHHIMRAYAGGRFECAETGLHPKLYHFDINSAHPSNMVDLPCLAHGHWEEHGPEYDIEGEQVLAALSGDVPPVALCHIKWDGSPRLRWGPFPWRSPKGSMAYPCMGEGVYWDSLIRAGMQMPGYKFTKVRWWAWVPECKHRPFALVESIYEERLRLGKDSQGLMLKVVLNAGYGSLADTVSENSDIASGVWAGLITAGTQAKLVEQLALHGDQITMLATDGLMATEPILPTQTAGKPLGAWGYKGESHNVLTIQPGLYLAETAPEGDKTRGHSYQDILKRSTELKAAWTRDGWKGQVTYDRRRFIPARLALTRVDYEGSYGQWQEVPCHIKFAPTHRITGPIENQIGYSYSGLKIHLNPDCTTLMSAPYQKLVDLDLELEKELESGQP